MRKTANRPYQQQQIYSDQQPHLMQTTQVPMYVQNGQPMPQIRQTFAGTRIPYPNQQFVMQNQEMLHQQNFVQSGYHHPVRFQGTPQYNYQPQPMYQHTAYNPAGYVVVNNQPQGGNNYILQQQSQINQGPSTSINQPRSVIYNTQNHHNQRTTQHIEPPAQKKRTAITLKDPNTGKDVTSELLKKKEPTSKSSTPVSQLQPPLGDDKAKLEANAQFAAQVAALSKEMSKADEKPLTAEEPKPANNETKTQNESTIEKNKKIDVQETVDSQVTEQNTVNENTVNTILPTSKTDEETESSEKLTNSIDAAVPTEDKQSNNDVEKIENKENIPTELPEAVVQEDIVEKLIVHEESKPDSAEDNEDSNLAINDTMINGHDSSSKSAFAKKKKKQRMRDIDSKDSSNDDLLSAFTDTPQPRPKEETEVKKLPKDTPKPESTWEDKEQTIDKEVIKNEDNEEPEIAQKQEIVQLPEQPRREETKIVKTGEETGATDEEKLQYDRDFLLKFQFAPICTSKPRNLPNIDIVLETAHRPTKPLDPEHPSHNMFIPTFMRQASGGRSSGGGNRSKDRRGPPSMSGSKPQKVIHIPQFEKLELKKSENAWVRVKEGKDLPDDDGGKQELGRNVRSILNKLTPQKFKTLVDQMTSLKIDSVEKLELSIGLIFEKAISEPGFSVAYANMCRVLTDVFKAVPGAHGEKSQSNIFRKILLNKCQKEFEKEKSDEKLIEEQRSKTFESEQEKKAWLEELDYRELQNRRRTLGNIRFIGELFKLKMISEKIMHECILKLLRNTKQESMEEQLECLCKLLTTIGKDLDHHDAKPRMDQYFQQMQKIIEKKKTSSRIRFALRDVMDLRNGGWVPRRDEGNPKTIDQIHREAQQKEKEAETQRQQDKLKRSEPRNNRGGGRDSPVVRAGSNTAADGWTSVPSKTSRSFAPTPVDASKFKIKKNDSSDISLGPGGLRPGAWSRGASGGTNSRSGSGSNTPTPEVDQKTNRYDLLSDSSTTPAFGDIKRGSRQSNSLRKSSQGTPNTNRRNLDERGAALRAAKSLSQSGSRNQSPARSGDSSRNSPSSGSQTPSGSQPVSPNPTSVDDEKMRKTTKSIVEEYFVGGDYNEAMLCIKELNAPQLHNVFVEEAIVIATEKKPQNRVQTGKLIFMFLRDDVVDLNAFISGFNSIVELAPDLAVDIPLIYKYLGVILAPIIMGRKLALSNLKDSLAPLIQFNKASIVMAEALTIASQDIANQDDVAELWRESGLKWEQLLDKFSSVDEFVRDKKVEYTLSTPSKKSHARLIQEELLGLLKSKTEQKSVMEYIDKKTEGNITSEIIREITYSVCRSAITEESNSMCKCDKNLLNSRKNILLRYINGSKDLELHATFALQQLVTDLNHPRGVLNSLFEVLYDGDIISEETINSWKCSKEFPDGKGNALSDVKAFMNWLEKAEAEESLEENQTKAT